MVSLDTWDWGYQPLSTWSWRQLGLLLAVSTFVLYGFHPIQRWKYRHIPGPWGYWYVGSLLDIIKKGQPQAYADWAQKYGPVFKFFQGSTCIVVLEDPDAVRKSHHKNLFRHPLPSVSTGKQLQREQNGILQSQGLLYRSLKAAWQPVFFSGSLEAYAALMTECLDVTLERLQQAATKGTAVNFWRIIGDLTMEVVGSTAFGVDLKTQRINEQDNDEAVSEIVSSARFLFDFSGVTGSIYFLLSILVRDLLPVISWMATKFPDKANTDRWKAQGILFNEAMRLLQDAKKEYKIEASSASHNGASNGQSTKTGALVESTEAEGKSGRKGVKPGSFLKIFFNASNRENGGNFTDEQIASQVFTFLLAGYETTASALAYAVYLLSLNQDKEAAMLAEIDAFGRDKTVSYDDLLNGFKYVEAVLKESLRVYPPGTLTLREAGEDMELGGFAIPKGTWLQQSIYGMHRSPRYWDEPERFLPERFLEGTPESAAKMAGAFAPFGDGYRGCVAYRFAQEEAKIALIRLYQRFTFRLAPGQVPLKTRTRITMSPQDGVFVTVHPRSEE